MNWRRADPGLETKKETTKINLIKIETKIEIESLAEIVSTSATVLNLHLLTESGIPRKDEKNAKNPLKMKRAHLTHFKGKVPQLRIKTSKTKHLKKRPLSNSSSVSNSTKMKR